jgi:DNA-binding SARP family transcriptional activator
MAIYERLKMELPSRSRAWEWFEPTERTLRELRCELARQLARHALATGRGDDALRLAHEMIEHDACDEAAREIAIATHVAKGDRAAALRHYRQYRDVLFAELQCQPSPSLAALLQLEKES